MSGLCEITEYKFRKRKIGAVFHFLKDWGDFNCTEEKPYAVECYYYGGLAFGSKIPFSTYEEAEWAMYDKLDEMYSRPVIEGAKKKTKIV